MVSLFILSICTIQTAGFSCGALDFLMDQVIQKYHHQKKFLSFGISTEDGGKSLMLVCKDKKKCWEVGLYFMIHTSCLRNVTKL